MMDKRMDMRTDKRMDKKMDKNCRNLMDVNYKPGMKGNFRMVSNCRNQAINRVRLDYRNSCCFVHRRTPWKDMMDRSV